MGPSGWQAQRAMPRSRGSFTYPALASTEDPVDSLTRARPDVPSAPMNVARRARRTASPRLPLGRRRACADERHRRSPSAAATAPVHDSHRTRTAHRASGRVDQLRFGWRRRPSNRGGCAGHLTARTGDRQRPAAFARPCEFCRTSGWPTSAGSHPPGDPRQSRSADDGAAARARLAPGRAFALADRSAHGNCSTPGGRARVAWSGDLPLQTLEAMARAERPPRVEHERCMLSAASSWRLPETCRAHRGGTHQ